MASSTPAGKGRLSWAFDALVSVTGVGLGAAALARFALPGQLSLTWVVIMLVGVPLIVVMARFPLVLSRGETGLEVGFESAALVCLACFQGGSGALAIWGLGQVLSQLTTSKRMDVRAFNTGLSVLGGALALATMRAIAPLDHTSLRELLAVSLGCLVYFLTDYVVSAVSISVERRTSLVAELKQNNGLLAAVLFVAIDSLGYLSTIVIRSLPGWAAVLLAVPIVTILVATRAISRGAEHQRRLTALFTAAAQLQAVESYGEALDALDGQVRAVVVRDQAGLRQRPPGAGEIGAPVTTGDQELWLVSPAGGRARSTVDADRQALETLASVGQEALSRLRLGDQMARQAREDALTGLPNRSLLVDRLEKAVAGATSSAPVAVLYLDLDGFKSVNDRFGHAAGDDLLRAVATRLRAHVRDGDVVARLGGDEFAVVVQQVEDDAQLEQLCRRLVTAMRAEITVAEHEVVVSTSIGLAVWAPGDDAATLLRHADMAMYRAKTLGKNQYFRYEGSLGQERVNRLELIEALRHGIDHELVVHYQPVVDLAGERTIGLEALVRWQRGDTLVPPDVFITAAEESGLIVPLGARVLDQVVRDAPMLVAAAGHPLDLAVNMSALQLRDPAFVGQVRRAAAALGRSRLVLEMTETVLVQDDLETAETLLALTQAGAFLSIDDFGVGFSSIGYLQHLPVSSLKIDRSFTRDIDLVPRARALVDAILAIAKALDLDVVAEGIERPEQAQLLAGGRCPRGQGFLFARPRPLPDVLATLRAEALAHVPPSPTGPLPPLPMPRA